MLTFLTSVSTIAICLSCNNAPPTAPRIPRGPLLTVGSGFDIGCTTLEVTRVAPGSYTVAPVSGSSCGPLTPVVDSTPTYDAGTGTLRIAVTLNNTSPWRLKDPVSLFGWPDSTIVTSGTGTVGMPSADSLWSDAAQTHRWRYDTLLAASGQPQVLARTSRSRPRWLSFSVPASVTAFQLRLRSRGTWATPPVPDISPDSIPAWFADDSSWTSNRGRMKSVIDVAFKTTATQADRQALVDVLRGEVVGGFRADSEDGIYFIRVPLDSTGSGLGSAISAALNDPSVVAAVQHLRLKPAFRFPKDSAQIWGAWAIKHGDATTSRHNWALEAVSAPLAWGCSVGSDTTRIGVIDYGFDSTEVDLNVALGRDVYSKLKATDSVHHGGRVASVLAARGDNGRGLSGVMWKAELDLQHVDQFAGSLAYADAIAAAVKRGTNIFNISTELVAFNPNSPDPLAPDSIAALSAAANIDSRLNQKLGMFDSPILIVAAGNGGTSAAVNAFARLTMWRPNHTIVVGGTQHANTPARLAVSNYGPLVDVYAPGIASTLMRSGGDERVIYPDTGTSVSAPIVTGIVGLLMAFDPTLSRDSIKPYIIRGATRRHQAVVDAMADSARYFVDAYETLKIAAERIEAPLCGTPLFAVPNSSGTAIDLLALRDSTVSSGGIETLATNWQGYMTIPYHGGRRVASDYGEYIQWTPNSHWSYGGNAWPPGPVVDEGGSFRSLMAMNHEGTKLAKIVQISQNLNGSFYFEVAVIGGEPDTSGAWGWNRSSDSTTVLATTVQGWPGTITWSSANERIYVGVNYGTGFEIFAKNPADTAQALVSVFTKSSGTLYQIGSSEDGGALFANVDRGSSDCNFVLYNLDASRRNFGGGTVAVGSELYVSPTMGCFELNMGVSPLVSAPSFRRSATGSR